MLSCLRDARESIAMVQASASYPTVNPKYTAESALARWTGEQARPVGGWGFFCF